MNAEQEAKKRADFEKQVSGNGKYPESVYRFGASYQDGATHAAWYGWKARAELEYAK